jgi:hypothetical protein
MKIINLRLPNGHRVTGQPGLPSEILVENKQTKNIGGRQKKVHMPRA